MQFSNTLSSASALARLAIDESLHSDLGFLELTSTLLGPSDQRTKGRMVANEIYRCASADSWWLGVQTMVNVSFPAAGLGGQEHSKRLFSVATRSSARASSLIMPVAREAIQRLVGSRLIHRIWPKYEIYGEMSEAPVEVTVVHTRYPQYFLGQLIS